MAGRNDIERRAEEIERKHFERCMWQAVLPNKRAMVECMLFAKAKSTTTVMVVKHFDGELPCGRSNRKFPSLEAVYHYLPIDDGNSWDSLDKVLTAMHLE